MEQPKRKLAAFEIPCTEWSEPFWNRRAIKLDDLVAIHCTSREIPREYPARAANCVKNLIGGLLWGRHELDPHDAVISHNGQRPLCRPLAVEKEHFRKSAIPRISQLDVAAIDLRRSNDEFRQPVGAERARFVDHGVKDQQFSF